jgi:hypothetical protein
MVQTTERVRTCGRCGERFVVKHGNQKYCGNCKWERKCSDCRRKWQPPPLSRQKLCPDCRELRHARHPRQCRGCYTEFIPKKTEWRCPDCRTSAGKVRKCRTCGTEFEGYANRQYCKPACRPNRNRVAKPYAHLKGSECERCGFVPEHSCQLDVHHLDRDWQNNDPANVQTLCANCHRLTNRGPRKPVGTPTQILISDA